MTADHRTDLVAVDVDIAYVRTIGQLLRAALNARVQTERQAVALCVYVVQNFFQIVRVKGRKMYDWAEHFFAQIGDAVDLNQGRRDEMTACGVFSRNDLLVQHLAVRLALVNIAL